MSSLTDLEKASNMESSEALLMTKTPKLEAGRVVAGTNNQGGSGVSSTVKAMLLCAVVVQNATLNVSARRSRVAAEIEEEKSGCGYKSTTAVVVIEVLKIVLSFALYTAERMGDFGVAPISAFCQLASTTSAFPVECAKILVPALLYTVQNNLLLVAADNLEGPVLALFGQLKILATALFSVVLLRRTLGARRWVSLLALTLSIALVQISQMHPSHPDHDAGTSGGGDEGAKNMPLGLAVTCLISTISGFSGVYFEMVLKGSPISVWVRNIHLASFSAIVATVAVFSADRAHVERCGFLAGYSPAVWVYVAVQAGGGLLIAAVIKYADNILKAFATSVAIVVVALVSAIFYDFELSEMFFAGSAGVIYAVLLYGDIVKEIPGCNHCPTALGGQTLSDKQLYT